jgi:hypothetical protein
VQISLLLLESATDEIPSFPINTFMPNLPSIGIMKTCSVPGLELKPSHEHVSLLPGQRHATHPLASHPPCLSTMCLNAKTRSREG